MSLLQDVLRSHTADIEKKLNSLALAQRNTQSASNDDSDDELVTVTSVPGTPARTRPPSPTKVGALARKAPGPLRLTNKRDPLKALPTEVSQRVFKMLGIIDLAQCALVSRKWCKSQTINYVWFQHYRKENFHDESLPAGKWTKRESKQNWRMVHLQSAAAASRSPTSPSFPQLYSSGYSSPSYASGYQTPRELKEEKWRVEADTNKLGKVELRGMYKELGGRKSRTKGKLGSAQGGIRDKGGWDADGGGGW